MVQFWSKRNTGYTLVELLAVTSIMVIVSGLIAGVLYSTLRGGTKTRSTNDVAQNGNFAMSVISNVAYTAQSVTKIDGNDIADCATPKKGKSIEFEQADGSSISFLCDAGKNSIASQSGTTTSYLIDNSTTQVDLSDPAKDNCSFTCTQSNNDPYAQPIIQISFTVSQRSSSTLFENLASSPFSTSVTMRNYNPK